MLRETLTAAYRVLEKAGAAHALIGGLALSVWGVHRATADVDFLVDGSQREAVKAALLAEGFVLRFENVEVMHFEGVGHLDLVLSNRPPTQKMLATAIMTPNLNVKCVAAEDIIGLKIQAYVNSRYLMTFTEYLDFLDEYWLIFGPIPEAEPKTVYFNVRL